jgi:Zn-dependent protease with chaperone function
MPAKLSKTVNFFSSHGDLDARIRFLNKIKEDYRSNL